MNQILGIGIVVAAIALGVWWWRRNYVPSPLDVHTQELQNKQQVGNLVTAMRWAALKPIAMVGEGWGTTMRVNPTAQSNMFHNRPGYLRLNPRFAQPGNQT